MKPFDVPNDALQVMPENAYWRDVANYDRVIAKLYFYLKPLNWQPIDAAHATGWHKKGIRDIRNKRYVDCQDSYPWVALDQVYDSRYERFKGCIRSTSLVSIQNGSRDLIRVSYVGRLIRRDVLQGKHGARCFAKLALPIPTPVALAQRQMQAAWRLHTKVLAHLDEQAQATSLLNRREYLAKRLREISLDLSYDGIEYFGGLAAWLPSIWLSGVLKIDKCWLLSPTLEPLDFDTSSWINPPAPGKVGEIRAKVDYFWQCLYDFHEAERPSIPAPLAASAVMPEETLILPARRNHDQLRVKELALLCVYAGHCITDANAKEYLEGKLKSGRALYNRFTHYSSQSNRTGFADETAQVRKNMIARIQKVLPRLNDEQKKRAENDIHTLTAQN